MTREQLKALLPEGTTDEAIGKVLDAVHAEITPHKDAAKKAQDDLAAKIAELDGVSKKAATADEKTKAYDDLLKKYNDDLAAANARAAAVEFDSVLDGVLRDKGARNIKAARAMLDLDTLRASTNRDADIAAAVDGIVTGEDTAFLFGAAPAAPTGEHAGVGGGAHSNNGEAQQTASLRAAFGLPTK